MMLGVRVLVAAVSILSMASANAMLIRVSQESSAGAGDFDGNVLGFISAYETALTVADFYKYDNPNAFSYNGELNGGPLPVSDLSQTFFVNGSDGLALVMVHDQPNDGDGGSTQTSWNLSGDTAAQVVADDPGEPVVVSGGGTQFDSTKNWVSCCTDGYAIGMLDGDWEMIGSFLRAAGIDQWQATSADGASVSLILSSGQRARFDTVSVPEPGTLVLLSASLLGLGFVRRKQAA